MPHPPNLLSSTIPPPLSTTPPHQCLTPHLIPILNQRRNIHIEGAIDAGRCQHLPYGLHRHFERVRRRPSRFQKIQTYLPSLSRNISTRQSKREPMTITITTIIEEPPPHSYPGEKKTKARRESWRERQASSETTGRSQERTGLFPREGGQRESTTHTSKPTFAAQILVTNFTAGGALG